MSAISSAYYDSASRLYLGFTRRDKLGVLGPGGEGDPGVVEDVLAEAGPGAAPAALGLDKVLWEGAVGGAQALARCIVCNTRYVYERELVATVEKNVPEGTKQIFRISAGAGSVRDTELEQRL